MVEMGEKKIQSFQRREKLENPEILSTHSKGERVCKRGMGGEKLRKLKKKGRFEGENKFVHLFQRRVWRGEK